MQLGKKETWPTLGKTQPRPDLGSCRPPSSRTAGPDGSGFSSHFHYPRVTISDLSQSRVLGTIGPVRPYYLTAMGDYVPAEVQRRDGDQKSGMSAVV